MSASRLTGKKIMLDPGHGGEDPGAVGPTGLQEKSCTLKVATYVKNYLEKYAYATVNMTRSSDVYVSLQKRVELANNWGADRFISIHFNSSTTPSVNGTETFYYNDSSNPTRTSLSKNLAEKLQTRLIQELGLSNRGVKTANFYVIKYTKMPASLTESSFISNPQEEARLKNTDYIIRIAKAHYYGIMDHYQINPTPLKSKKIYIDPAYGGSQNGPIGPTGLKGKDVTFKIANYAYEWLVNAGGANVKLSRTADVDVSDATRVSSANSWGAERYIRIGINAASNTSANGTETYYRNGNQISFSLATSVNDRIVQALGLTNRGVKPGTSSMYELFNSNAPAIRTYPSFITNPQEEARLKDNAYLEKIGKAIYFGICDNYNVAP